MNGQRHAAECLCAYGSFVYSQDKGHGGAPSSNQAGTDERHDARNGQHGRRQADARPALSAVCIPLRLISMT